MLRRGPSVKMQNKIRFIGLEEPCWIWSKHTHFQIVCCRELPQVGAGTLETRWSSSQSGSSIGQGLAEAGWKFAQTNLQRRPQSKRSKHMCCDLRPKVIQNRSRPAQNKHKMNPLAKTSHVKVPEPSQKPFVFRP